MPLSFPPSVNCGKLFFSIDPAVSWAPFDVDGLDAKAHLVPMADGDVDEPTTPVDRALTAASYGEEAAAAVVVAPVAEAEAEAEAPKADE
eukprot:SAG22_NODE_8613_length_641_cov_1.326568_2_plen_90_part_00